MRSLWPVGTNAKAMLLRLALIGLVIALLPHALADEIPTYSQPEPPAFVKNILKYLTDLGGWLQVLQTDFGALFNALKTVTYPLVLLGLVVSAVRAILLGGLGELQAGLLRVGLAALFLSLGPTVERTTRDVWSGLYQWGGTKMETTIQDASQYADKVASLIVPFAGLAMAAKHAALKGAEGALKNAGSKAMKEAGEQVQKALNYVNAAVLLFIPIVIFYYVLQILTSFILEAGLALYPLAAATIALPGGTGGLWMSRWVQTVLGTLMVVAVLPIGFRGAIEVAFIRPANTLSTVMEDTINWVQSWVDYGDQQLEQVKQQDKTCSWNPTTWGQCMEKFKNWLEEKVDQLWDQVAVLIGGIWGYVKGVIIGGLVMLIGMIAGAYILFNVERMILAYIGGVVMGGINRLVGTAYTPIPLEGGGGRATPASPPPLQARLVPQPALPSGGGRPALPSGGGGDVVDVEWRPVVDPGLPPPAPSLPPPTPGLPPPPPSSLPPPK